MDKKHTFSDVCACAGKLSLPQVVHLLRSYNATRIMDLSPNAYLDFIDQCHVMLIETPPTAELAANVGMHCKLNS